ncbi:hypothetical protein I316_01250 [Kwoniella heveanensis BCC8398]|uniref:Uncharacterized protein n=1 Tax=Kwoniella heveanensis BCC8398 TaxID=1296120 RepID=A0A1B9H236_9TREE|nr:hypothetical protein I316_01250 [Kwoniella heveanensis BCC8398]
MAAHVDQTLLTGSECPSRTGTQGQKQDNNTQEQSSPYSSPPASCRVRSPLMRKPDGLILPTTLIKDQEQSMTPPSCSQVTSSIKPDPPSSTSTERIVKLVQTISTVLSGYSALPSASQIYISSLTQFHQRALTLAPEGLVNPLAGPAALSSPTLSSRGSGTSLFQMLLARHQDRNPSPNGVIASTPRISPTFATSNHKTNARPPSLAGIEEDAASPSNPIANEDAQSSSLTLEEKVDRLEREWWDSEVVAAWYGPRPPVRSWHPRSLFRPAQTSPSSSDRIDTEISPRVEGDDAPPSKLDNSSSHPMRNVPSEGLSVGTERPPLTRKEGFSRIRDRNGTPKLAAEQSESSALALERHGGGTRRCWNGRKESVRMFFRGDAGYVGLQDEWNVSIR